MSNKTEQGARLDALIKASKMTQSAFAQLVGVTQGYVTQMITGRKSISAKVINNITLKIPKVNIDWLLNGVGGIYLESENEQLDAEVMERFSSNLSVLLPAREMDPVNLAPIIGVDTTVITDLLHGRRLPSLSLVIRLRKALDVPMDALLFSDFNQEGVMDNLKENDRLEQMLQAMLKRLEKLEAKEREREEEQKAADKEVKDEQSKLNNK